MRLKYIGHFFGWLLLGGNALLAALMLLCAYSPYIDPVEHPVLSCTGLAFPIFLLLNLLFLLFWLLFYRKYALLPLIALVACAGQIRAYFPINTPTSDIPEDAFKILSYNVMAYDHDKPHKADNPNEIIDYLANSNADIICTQEAILNKPNNSKFLNEQSVKEALSAYPYHSHHQESSTNGWDCYSRYPILSAQKINYTSKSNGSMAYEILLGKDTLLLINNHLESNKLTTDDKEIYRDMIVDPEKEKVKNASRLLLGKITEAASIRGPQADSIAKFIQENPHKYIVVCGDFNDSPISYAHRVITNQLNDAFVSSGNGLGISYNRNGFYFRIDHILNSNNFEAYNCTVDKSIKTSDHYPIWCYLRKR